MEVKRAVGGRFEPLRLAGSGGMGRVHEARDAATGERVALKTLLRTGILEEARFVREAEALSRVVHPGVVRHVAHGRTEEGDLYLAMEWIEGETLRARLRRSPLGMAESVTLAVLLADALGAVHAAGIVHRDLKPNNVVLAGGALDRPVLVDFGLARLPGVGRLTCSGMMLGTPGYMAPEQARGEPDVDARADVFALGCVLFRCLTGTETFRGADPLQLLLQLVLEEPPRVSTLRAEVPQALDDLVARCLSNQRELRPPGGHAVAAELRKMGAFSRGAPSVQSMPPPPPSSKRITSSERRITTLVLVRDPGMDLGLSRAHAAGSAGELTRGAARRAEAARDVIARHRGRVEVLADDALLVALTSAAAPTDLAARAARCALSLRSALGEVPMAVATGWAETEGRQPMGELIGRAVRVLEAAAGAGAPILVDDVTARLLGTRFDVAGGAAGNELRGEHGEDEPPSLLLGKPSICVGRDREIGALESAAVQCADESSAAATLITGRPGTGKSRLRKELLRRLRGRDLPHETWIGHGDPMGAGAAFGMLARAIRSALAIREGDPPAERRARIEAATRDLPEAGRTALFLGELLGVRAPSEGHPHLEAARRDPLLMGDQLRRAAEDLLRARCEERLVVLVLEDAQWGDHPTMTFVDSALRNLSSLPLFVLALGRPEVSTLFPRLWEDRPHSILQLGGLPRRAAERLLAHALGAEPPEQIQALVERADGNPFYLEELIRAVAEGQRTSFPETVLAMAQARIETLRPEARQILRAASVFGNTFFAAGVEALLGGTPVALQLADLVERELLTRGDPRRGATALAGDPAPAGEMELHFRHALVRDAAYGMLTESDRALGHRLAAEWLEDAGKGDAVILAEHFERGGEQARAVKWYRKAAQEALQGNDLPAAVARAERAVACGAEGERLGELRWIQAEAHLWRGELSQAEERAMQAIGLSPAGSEIWYRALTSASLAASKQGAVERLAEHTRTALGPVPHEGARGARLYCLAYGACELALAGRCADADELIARATDLPADRALADVRALGVLHQTCAIRAILAGEPDAALAGLELSLSEMERAGDRRNACSVRGNIGYLRAELGDFAGAEGAMRAELADAEEMGLHDVVAHACQNLGYILCKIGRLDEARAFEERSVEICRAHGYARMLGGSLGYLARIELRSGDAAKAERSARAAAALLEVAPPLRASALAVLSQALLAQGRAEEALGSAQEAFAQLEAEGHLEEGEALVRLSCAEALLANGRGEESSRVLAAARERLLRRAARIRDPLWRERFLTEVPEHAATMAFDGSQSG